MLPTLKSLCPPSRYWVMRNIDKIGLTESARRKRVGKSRLMKVKPPPPPLRSSRIWLHVSSMLGASIVLHAPRLFQYNIVPGKCKNPCFDIPNDDDFPPELGRDDASDGENLGWTPSDCVDFYRNHTNTTNCWTHELSQLATSEPGWYIYTYTFEARTRKH